jgi:restriction endonuclease S subunit
VKTTESTAFLPQSVLDVNQSTICRVSPFDIIVAKGGNSLAKLGLVPEDYKTYALSRDLIAIKTSKLKRNKYFVWLFLHSDFGQSLLWRTASQTGQPHLNLPSIDALDIPIFSREFETIAENLYRTSVKCKSDAVAAYAASESMLIAALGLGDFSQSNGTMNLKSFRDSFASTGRLDAEHYQPKYDQLHQALIAYSGGTTTVGELAGEIANGAEVREYQESGTPYLRVGDLKFLDIEASSVVKIHPKSAETGLEKIDLQVGDVLISRSGSLAISAVVEAPWDKALISSHLIRLRIVDKRINPYFLALFFMTLPGKM